MTGSIKTIDLFAGCGGLLEGFEMTGKYLPIAAVEWEKAPCETLIKHLSELWGIENSASLVLRFDMQRSHELIHGWRNDPKYGSSQGLDALVDSQDIDIIIGGPPCQAYSVAGRIRDEHGMKLDYRNYLFESYLEIVKHYKPRAFVFENVPGILTARPTGEPITR